MRKGLLILLLVFLAGYTAVGDAQETDDAIELNPLDFVPLAVGNRWTYGHLYINYDYEIGEPFAIPGYPPGHPPDSLTFAGKTVTIEITHTEVIDGSEYFVFSDADYAWPPLPDFFWGGKKVRLSDEGFLVFRWNGQELPMYDFGGDFHTYTGTLPIGSGATEADFDLFYAQYRRSRVHFGLSRYSLYDRAEIIFLQEYGVGQTYIEHYSYPGACTFVPSFLNQLTPISATISGEEIVYEQVYLSYQSLASTGLGQIGQVQLDEGFDCSEGKHSESSNDFELVRRGSDFRAWGFRDRDFFDFGTPSAKSACAPTGGYYSVLSSETGLADLGKMDFGLLISKGIPPDLRLDFGTEVTHREGHIYAVRSREGGIALLYVFDVEFLKKDYRSGFSVDASAENVKFDWVYYPDGLPDGDTAVQPTSWGQLKQLFLQDSPSKQE